VLLSGLVPKFFGRLPRPTLKSPHETLLVLKTHFGRDLFDGALRAQE
jgi:hypothetical protein